MAPHVPRVPENPLVAAPGPAAHAPDTRSAIPVKSSAPAVKTEFPAAPERTESTSAHIDAARDHTSSGQSPSIASAISKKTSVFRWTPTNRCQTLGSRA